MARNLSSLINRIGGYRNVGMVMRKKGLKRHTRRPKRRNLGTMMRRKRGGFLGALAASLAPMAIKGIGKLIKGKKKRGRGVTFSGGRGVTLSGSNRGRGFFGKLASVGKNVAKKAFNEFKKDPIGNATKAYNLGKKLYSSYKGSGRRNTLGRVRKHRNLLKGVHTSAPGAKTTTTISKHKLVNVPVKTLSVRSIKGAKKF